MAIDLLAVDEGGIADADDLDLLHHLANDHADVLVVDLHALQPVYFLDFVYQVALQLVLAENLQNVVRVDAAVAQQLAGLDRIAVPHQQVLTHRDRVLVLIVERIDHADRTLAFRDALELHHAADLGEHRRRLGPACLEQLADPRQTTGDVARLDALLEQLGQHPAGGHRFAILDVQVRLPRQIVAGHLLIVIVDQQQPRLQRLEGELGDLLFDLAGVLVDLFLERGAKHDVLEAHLARRLGDDRLRKRVEVGDRLVRRYHLADLHQHFRAIAHVDPLRLGDDQELVLKQEYEADILGPNGVAATANDLLFAEHLLAVLHQQLVVAFHGDLLNDPIHHQVALAAEQQIAVLAPDGGAMQLAYVHRIAQVDAVLLAHLGGSAADVEGTHGELRPRLAD